MNAMPQLNPDHSAPSAPAPDVAEDVVQAKSVSLAEASSAAPGAAPPHLLWETLESAYAAPTDSAPEPDEPRLAGYIALPIALGLSLVLWLGIVELVLMR